MTKIIVYGLGIRGKDFIRYVSELSVELEIVAVSDRCLHEVESGTEKNIILVKPSDIQKYSFDYIVVTPKDYYMDIRNYLLDSGVEKEKIVSVEDMHRKFGKYYCSDLLEGRLYCNLCSNQISAWTYIGLDYDIFHNKKIVGGARRRGGCPICGSIDRERFVYYVLKQYTNLMDGGQHNILHFAPEVLLSQKLRNRYNSNYISADIVPGRADVVADITKLQFSEGTFEYIICNHVMEHISLEEKAFHEIRRCLMPGGMLILTVPICWEQKTFEDEKITTKEERIKFYGQKDHVRLYGYDIVERVKKFGFRVTLIRCNQILEEDEILKYGFISEDVVLLCEKAEMEKG